MRRHAVRGITLLEMMVVLVLVAIVMGTALPILLGDGPTDREMRSAARQLAAAARHVRAEAVAQRRETFLVLDLENKRFRIDQDSREYQLPEAVLLALFTAQTDQISETVGSIRFFPDGGSNGGRITVSAGENSDRKYEVDIDWLTGRVAILE
ncbi:MAG: GspH/FimT family pseudopilin [Proteobacteria bacterium]|nr:GspH/FimT family pseudopilin [Pseudomonadota bacterium]MCL2307816.1 GspH/FimT family pseudopilin [Pseudomonadota bacterium]